MSGNMERVLRLMAERGASDVYLAVNTPILIRIDGQMVQLSEQLVSVSQMRQLLAEVLKPSQIEELDKHRELNTGIGLPGVGSFRISAFQQRGTLAAVLRCIPGNVPVPEELGLPRGLAELVLEKRGLILMAGATGTGKSTTLASMLEWRNQQMTGHILTIEDPIEFLFTNKRSIINQREVGRDTDSLHTALRNALRQAPDCILIGEIRDRETMGAALSMSLSGHLVLATLHANNSVHALGRILSFYPHDSRSALLADLSAALKAIVSQRLLRALVGGRVPAVEVLRNTKLVAEMIERGDLSGVKEAMESSMAPGSQTFEQDLIRLVSEGLVAQDEAVAYADSPANLMWKLQNRMAEAEAGASGPGSAHREPEPPVFTAFTVEVREPVMALPPVQSPPRAST
jgi:twitching motility protein PilU